MLRAVKNRFGSTSELGLFAMNGDGLEAVPDPSRLLLAERPQGAAGSVIVAALEGSRPLLVEVQALLVRAAGPPRRVVTGMDPDRVALVLAVVERVTGIAAAGMDAYFKITGGVNVEDPAIDLGIAAAAVSSVRAVPVAADWVLVGEVGLTGDLRQVPRIPERLREAEVLGFRRALVPGRHPEVAGALGVHRAQRLEAALALLGLEG